MAEILTPLRNYLVGQGIVRVPAVAAALPPLWLAPKRQNAPGEGQNAVEQHPDTTVGLFRTPGIPSEPREGFIRRDGLQFVIRTVRALLAYNLESQLRAVLHDREHFAMDTVTVEQALLTSDLTSLGLSDGDRVFDFSLNYVLTTFSGP